MHVEPGLDIRLESLGPSGDDVERVAESFEGFESVRETGYRSDLGEGGVEQVQLADGLWSISSDLICLPCQAGDKR